MTQQFYLSEGYQFNLNIFISHINEIKKKIVYFKNNSRDKGLIVNSK